MSDHAMSDNALSRLTRVLSGAMDAGVVPGFSRIGYAVRSRLERWTSPSTFDLSGKTIVLTGPTSGLGAATARMLAPTGARLVLVARNRDKAERTRAEMLSLRPQSEIDNDIEIVIADMGDMVSVARAADEILSRHHGIDVLIHNAGALFTQREVSPQGIESTIASHVLGPHLMTTRLLDALRTAHGRVIMVSSGGMYAAEVPACDARQSPEMPPATWNGTKQYAIAKRMQVVLSAMWAEREPGVFFAAMHPGWADTPGVQTSIPMFGRITKPILRTPEQGADTIAYLAATPNKESLPSGKFWCDRAIRSEHKLPTTARTDTRDRRDAVWNWCQQRIAD